MKAYNPRVMQQMLDKMTKKQLIELRVMVVETIVAKEEEEE